MVKVELNKQALLKMKWRWSKSKEWKTHRITQLGMGVLEIRVKARRVEVAQTTLRGVFPMAETPTSHSGSSVHVTGEDGDLKMMDLIKNLSSEELPMAK